MDIYWKYDSNSTADSRKSSQELADLLLNAKCKGSEQEKNNTIYSFIFGPVQFSLRIIASILGISKSSVHRRITAIKKRDLYPESHLWETEEGTKWLRLLYFGAILFFVVHLGIGAEKLSIFFKFLRLNNRIAISPSVIKKIAVKISELLDQYQEEQQAKHKIDEPPQNYWWDR